MQHLVIPINNNYLCKIELGMKEAGAKGAPKYDSRFKFSMRQGKEFLGAQILVKRYLGPV